MHGPYFLGIDTGGTYTDAAVFSPATGVVAKAKALTTRHDLALGVEEAAEKALAAAGLPPTDIALVSLSTTLATNALVEGQGGRAGLVMIGFGEADLERDGLRAALGADPVVFCPGGHDVHGNARGLDLSALDHAIPQWVGQVTGVAVCSLFSTRNPAHELAAMEKLRAAGLPVTGSHELTSRLGGPRRALTTLLNARLVPMIARLIGAVEGWLAAHRIAAPLMVVRGDGALVSAAFARQRPIETILSGPAASLVGARFLADVDAAIVSDIGGTTTDVAVLADGRPRLDPEGATVGGWRTMVEAVAMRTFGLGGDSEVSLVPDGLGAALKLGPRRLVPLALLGQKFPDQVQFHLDRQLKAAHPHRFEGRFALATGLSPVGLSPPEARLLEKIGIEPAPLDRLIAINSDAAVLDRLAGRGLVHLCGYTPSDAAHVLERQENWNSATADLGATLFARKKDGRGVAIAADAREISARVLAAVTRRSAEVILETALVEDDLDASFATHPLLRRALDHASGIARLKLSLDRPVIGLGASAGLHYAHLSDLLGTEVIVPDHADVANAVGAVVGQVRVAVEAHVSQPREGLFRVQAGPSLSDFTDEASALAQAEAETRHQAFRLASDAGAADAHVEIVRDLKVATIEGNRTFIEATVTSIATGRPRIAS